MKKTSLLLGSILSFVISIVHIGAIIIGPSAYIYLDAPELAVLAQTGSWIPAILTLCMALVFGLFSLYALSAIHVVQKLPFTQFYIDYFFENIKNMFEIWKNLISNY